MATTTRKIGKHLVTVKLSAKLPKGFVDLADLKGDRTKAKPTDKIGRPFIYLDMPDYSKLKNPQKGFGLYLPAIFEVDGLPCKIVFTLDQLEKGKAKLGITDAQLICPKGVAEFLIPWQRLQSMAINSASFLVEHLPPNYEKWLTLNMRVSADERGGSIPKGQATLPQDVRQELLGGKEKFEGSKENYEKIALIWRSAPHGKKHKEIANHFGFSEKWAHKHTAIGAERYPKLFPNYKKQPTKKKGRKTK